MSRRSQVSRAAVVTWAVGWAAGWCLGWRLPALAAPPTAGGANAADEEGADATTDPTLDVAVIIPARNEADTITGLLAGVAAQQPAPAEVVVVDDGSTDPTADRARAGGATLITAPALPAGWTGKAWACYIGVAATTAATVVLVDADVTFEPGALQSLVHEHRRRRGLVSVLPHHRPVAAYEQLSASFNLVSVMGTGAARPGARGASDGAFGPVLVTTRADLARAGGFEAVAGEVIEDIALAQRYASAGLPVTSLAGGELLGFRMYPAGLAQLVEGWTKNMAAGASAVPWWRAALIALWVAAGLAPAAGLLGRRRRSGPTSAPTPHPALLAVLAWLATTVQFGVLTRRIGRFRWWVAPLHPVLLSFFGAVVARSGWRRAVVGQVEWRGRQIPVGSSPLPRSPRSP